MNREPRINNNDQEPKGKEKPESFVMYESWFQAAEDYEEDFGLGYKFLKCVCYYGLFGEVIEETKIKEIKPFFPTIIAQIDHAKRHPKGAPKGNNNAAKDRPEKTNKNNRKQSKTNKNKSNININVNVNDNVDEKENGKINSSTSLTPDNKDSALLPLESCYAELIKDSQWLEWLCMRYRKPSGHFMNIDEMKEQIRQFIDVLIGRHEKSKSIRDGKSHFFNWMEDKFRKHEGPFSQVPEKGSQKKRNGLPGAENISDQEFEDFSFGS